MDGCIERYQMSNDICIYSLRYYNRSPMFEMFVWPWSYYVRHGNISVNCRSAANVKQRERYRSRQRRDQWRGSIPAVVVWTAWRQLFFHMVRLVTTFNRRASGRLRVAAVVLDGDCVTAHIQRHTDRHADIQTETERHTHRSTTSRRNAAAAAVSCNARHSGPLATHSVASDRSGALDPRIALAFPLFVQSDLHNRNPT